MTSNSVFKKMQQFISEEVSFSEFEQMLLNSSARWPVKVGWITETGKRRYYKMYWDENRYVGGNAGGSDTKAEMDMYNIRVLEQDGKWRTIDFNTVYKIQWRGKTYKVNN